MECSMDWFYLIFKSSTLLCPFLNMACCASNSFCFLAILPILVLRYISQYKNNFIKQRKAIKNYSNSKKIKNRLLQPRNFQGGVAGNMDFFFKMPRFFKYFGHDNSFWESKNGLSYFYNCSGDFYCSFLLFIRGSIKKYKAPLMKNGRRKDVCKSLNEWTYKKPT